MNRVNEQEVNSRGGLRWFWLALTGVALGLAILGAILPGLPTTVFVLIAAWSASKCSPRLRNWLENHSLFGERLRNWEQGGVIDRKSKITASIGMCLAAVIVVYVIGHPLLLMLILGTIGVGALVVWSRPEQLPESSRNSRC
ncbi:YbaN family protein [Marinobacterium sp. YM272]|uniref:YbaN family protein n=1 Tax=Marinobacterium sp. YM272 TaxID=3421654 RepID=UPI003D7FBFAA